MLTQRNEECSDRTGTSANNAECIKAREFLINSSPLIYDSVYDSNKIKEIIGHENIYLKTSQCFVCFSNCVLDYNTKRKSNRLFDKVIRQAMAQEICIKPGKSILYFQE